MRLKAETVQRRADNLEEIKAKYQKPGALRDVIDDMAGKMADEIIKAKPHTRRKIHAVSEGQD